MGAGKLGQKVDDPQALLNEACARNLTVELHFHAPNDEVLVAKSRFLGLDEQHVFLDKPQSIGKPIELSLRQRFDAYMALQESRFAFQSQVVDLQRLMQLNRKMRVIGIVIARPTSIKEGQRRAYFRASLLGNRTVCANVHASSLEAEGAAPINAQPFTAEMINLSVGGVALNVDIEHGRKIRIGDELFIGFDEPGEDQEYMLLAEVRQTRKIAEDTAVRLGMQFKAWPSAAHLRRVQRDMQKFITRLQRASLKKSA